MLTIENTILIVVDAQGRLARVVAESEAAIERIGILVQGAKLLGIPTLLTAQAPEKIGHTIPEIASLLPEQADLPRMSFSIWRDQAVRRLCKPLAASKCCFAALKRIFAFTKVQWICLHRGLKFIWSLMLFLRAG